MRQYRILALHPGPHNEDECDEYSDLGIAEGHSAKGAIESALADVGLPKDVKVCIGIPRNNWSEYDVEHQPRPQFKVMPRLEPPLTQPTSPDPDDAT